MDRVADHRNLGAVETCKEFGLPMIGDFSLNVANLLTARLLMEECRFENLTISYDLNEGQVSELLSLTPPEWLEITVHQHMPMFHMEHCVFCTFLSNGGTSILNCGKPCEKHHVQLKDRVGQLHTLKADVGCRNTLFNGRAQTGARFYQKLRGTGLRKFRVDFLDEDRAAARQTILAYQNLLAGETSGHHLWQNLDVMEQLGVTEGTLQVIGK